MIQFGRFTLRDLSDQGEGFIERVMLIGEIQPAVAEQRRLSRVAQSQTDAGRDATATNEAVGMLRAKTISLSIQLIEASLVEVDGAPVDLDNDDDRARVRRALGKLSQEEWTSLVEAMKGESKSDG